MLRTDRAVRFKCDNASVNDALRFPPRRHRQKHEVLVLARFKCDVAVHRDIQLSSDPSAILFSLLGVALFLVRRVLHTVNVGGQHFSCCANGKKLPGMIYRIHPFDWIAVIQICKLSKFVTAANCLCVVVNKSIPPPVAAAVPPEARRMACATAIANIFFG